MYNKALAYHSEGLSLDFQFKGEEKEEREGDGCIYSRTSYITGDSCTHIMPQDRVCSKGNC